MRAWPKRRRPGRSRHVDDDRARAIASSRTLQQLAGREVAEAAEHVEAELAAEHRRPRTSGPRQPSESRGQALADHATHAGRDAQMRVGLRQPALGVEQAHDLGHEQRVALGLGRGSPRPGRAPGATPVAPSMYSASAARLRPGQRHLARRGARARARPACERSGRPQRRVDVAVGARPRADGCRRSRGRRSAGAAARTRRRRAGRRAPARAARSRARRRAGTRLTASKRRKRAPSGLERRRLRDVGNSARAARAGAGPGRPPGAEPVAQHVGIGLADVGAQRLDPRPVGGAPPASQQRPTSDPAPRARARGASAPRPAGSCRCPGSPTTSTTLPRPAERVVERRRRARPARARAPRTPPGGARRPAGARSVERRVLAQDRRLKLAQLAARLDPELLDERAPGLAGRPRAPRPAGPSGTARASAGARRRSRSGCARIRLSSSPTTSAWRPSARSASMRSSSARQPQLLQPGDLRLGERLVGDVGQRPAAPQRERLAQHLRAPLGSRGQQRAASRTSRSKRAGRARPARRGARSPAPACEPLAVARAPCAAARR